MRRREFLQQAVGLLAGGAGTVASLRAQTTRQAAPSPSSPPPATLTLTTETTLAQVLDYLDACTPATLQMSPQDRALAESYRLPPALQGYVLDGSSVASALNFLTGKGWEGSRLDPSLREQAGAHYLLARLPYVNGLLAPQVPQHWVCNNAMWAWRWEKTGQPGTEEKERDGGVFTVFRRLTEDGDVVKTEPLKLRPITDELTLETVLDWIKQRQGVYVNLEGSLFVPVTEKDQRGRPFTRLEPMRMQILRPLWGYRLNEAHTLGEWLHLFAIGMNLHTRSLHGDWRWSSTVVEGGAGGPSRVIYTLRDYAHLPR